MVKKNADYPKLKPCPYCGDIWLYVSDGDYYSGYEAYGYRVECQCGFAWNAISWCNTREQAINEWNKIAEQPIQ